jgi:hypothetical protein
MSSDCKCVPSDKEEVLFSGNTNFSVVSRTINGKKHTIIKHSGELDMENNSLSELLECVSKVIEETRRRS